MRYSAGSEDIGGGAGRYETQPYYSGTRTVTTAGPSDEVIFRPASARIDDRVSSPRGVLLPPSLGEVPAREDVVIPYTSIKLRPLSMSPAELEQMILEDVKAISESKKLTDEQYGFQIEPSLQDLRIVSDKTAELKRDLLVEDELLRLPTRAEPCSLEVLETVSFF